MLLKLLYVPILNTFYMSNYATGVSIPPPNLSISSYKFSIRGQSLPVVSTLDSVPRT